MKIQCHVDANIHKLASDAAVRRAELKLSRFADVIREVILTIRDINGPRGGLDTRCKVQILLKSRLKIITSETAVNEKDAIAGSLDRATRTLARRLQLVRKH